MSRADIWIRIVVGALAGRLRYERVIDLVAPGTLDEVRAKTGAEFQVAATG